ncbi:MAG: signal recognition particle-docking protein FtsY [Planctomycetota bacterium]
MGLFDKLKAGLKKTTQVLNTDIRDLFREGVRVDDEFLERWEEVLLKADLGVHLSQDLCDFLRQEYRGRVIEDPPRILARLKEFVKEKMLKRDSSIHLAKTPPTVILVAGVNGAGKTTSIAKLGNYFHKQGKKVMLAAGDTFRAAAVEQLSIWSERIGVPIVKHQQGADPSAVVFDALESACAKKIDILIIDTAGRLHTQENLMKELEKIRRVIQKKLPEAPHEVLLVLDATTGQNAINQAQMFNKAIQVTGLFLAKLDGTAKGGVILSINNQLNIPVKFIGTGETPEDIEAFDPNRFVDELLEFLN